MKESEGSAPRRTIESPESFLKLLWTCLFGIAMAFTEACVVVYIRQIFDAVRKPVDLNLWVVDWFRQKHPWVILTEQYREVSTIVMLVAVAYLSGRNARERWGIFLLAFGVWDGFYYLWLHLLTGWPPSLLTLDILFLIPFPWVAPVVAPLTAALVMALAGGWLILTAGRSRAARQE